MKLWLDITKQLNCVAACAVLLGLAAGCSSTRVDVRGQSTATAVTLSGKNYRLIQAGAKGQSSGFRFLGILPLGSPNYANARRALYASVNEPLTGRAVALANTMEDRSTLYLILFSVPKLTITADVIEFTEKAETK